MRKNVAGQRIGAQLVSATDGSAFTGSVTVAVTVDAGTQATGSVGSGACTHEGGGYHTYAPAQAETNGDLVAFTFSGTGAVPVTIQVYTRPATGLLAPTVADRTLDVSSTGEAGIDWANVGSPTTTNVLSGTTISSSQAVASVSGSVGSVAGNVSGNINGNVSGSVGSVVGNVGGNVTGSVGSVAANGITASSIATDAITAAKIAADAIGASELATDAVTEITNAVWSAATRVLTAGTNIVLAKGSGVTGFNDPTVAEIADGVWDEILGGHVIAGSAAVVLGDGAADAGEAREKSSFIWDDLENGGRIDLLIDAIKATTDKLDTAMVLDGAVWQFTVNALELAPAGGGGGSTDWNADERTAIRAILGIPGSGTTPADPTTGILDTIRDRTLLLSTQSSVDGKPTLSQIEASTVLAKEATLNGMRGATFDTATDSLEAIRNRGDAAWTTGSGGGGSSQAVIGSTNAITRNINEELPIQFTWNSASATITGTVEIGTASAVALQGAITFVRTDAGGKHWYQLAYDADDRPTVAGLARYVFTDGTDYLTVPVQFTEVASGGGGSGTPGNVAQDTADYIYITRNDSYDGTANAVKSFTVTKNYTGWTGTFTIRHNLTKAVLCTASVTVASSTLLTVSLSSTATAFALLVDDTEFGPHPFDIEMVNGSSKQQAAAGVAIVRKDVTYA